MSLPSQTPTEKHEPSNFLLNSVINNEIIEPFVLLTSTLKNQEMIRSYNPEHLKTINDLQRRFSDAIEEITRQKELISELETRLWTFAKNSPDASENSRDSIFREKKSFLENLHAPHDALQRSSDFSNPFSKDMVDNILEKIHLKRATMSPIERQSITSRSKSLFLHSKKTKKVNFLGNSPINSIETLTNFDIHYGVCSELRESHMNNQDKMKRSNLADDKTSSLEVILKEKSNRAHFSV